MKDGVIYFVTGNAGKLREVSSALQNAGDASECEPFPYRLEAVNIDLDELQSDSAETISERKALEAFRLVNQLENASLEKITDANGSTTTGLHSFRVSLPNEKALSLKATLVEDTSLSFSALNDLPGPYIKFFLSALGPEGLPRMVDGFASDVDAEEPERGHRRATATTVLSLAQSNIDESDATTSRVVVTVSQFVGHCPGCLVDRPRGAFGFGWDSVFAPLVNGDTYAENREALARYGKDPQTHRFPPPSAEMGFAVGEKAFRKTYAEMAAAEKQLLSHRAVALRKMRDSLRGEKQAPSQMH